MKLIEKTPKTLQCIVGTCPAIFKTDRNTYIVIGKRVSDKRISQRLIDRVGQDEIIVEFPKQLLTDIAIRKK